MGALRGRGRMAIGLERAVGPVTAPVQPRAEGPLIVAAELDSVTGSWAAIVFWHSLEHLDAPAAALRRAVGVLRPGGLLVLALPNADSLQANWFGARWFARDLPRHLTHIPAPELVRWLRSEGMRVERVSYVRGGQWVFGWLAGLVGALSSRLDLYDAIRTPAARSRPLGIGGRLASLTAGLLLWPVALLLGLMEASLRRGGTVYIEARR